MNYNIVKHIGTLSDGKITTELNVIEWNGRKAQYDLRRWSVDETGERTPLKGLCLSDSELEVLKQLIKTIVKQPSITS